MAQERIFLMLGSNLGTRDEHLRKARHLLVLRLGNLVAESSWYETASWGDLSQPPFLNQLLIMETEKSPFAALKICQEIEKEMGRERIKGNRNAGRSIDIDILYFGNYVSDDPELTLPHPRIAERKFVLIPLLEIAPQLIHPLWKKSHEELLDECTDPLEVRVYRSDAY
jgi:2-amino-4-hydroxy-6-hydroxymethyldihydropteridine diphosphokinase